MSRAFLQGDHASATRVYAGADRKRDDAIARWAAWWGRFGSKSLPAMGIKIGQGISMQVYLCKDIYTWISMHGYPRMDIRVFVCIIVQYIVQFCWAFCSEPRSHHCVVNHRESSVVNERVIIVWWSNKFSSAENQRAIVANQRAIIMSITQFTVLSFRGSLSISATLWAAPFSMHNIWDSVVVDTHVLSVSSS